VGNDQAMDPWLDEAFAVYSELLFYETYYPGYLEWWWWTRVDRYPSTYCIDQSIYAFADFRSYVNTVYLRGATMLHELRQSMGKADFMESLRELQTAGFGSILTPAEVLRIFQAHSSVPLSGVWKEFLCQPVPSEEG
jgi:aminopeptidase N